MTKEIIFSDATRLAELIRTKEVSPLEVVQAHLDRIAAVNPKINAIVTLADGALKAAKRRRRQRCWRPTNTARCTVSPSR